MVRFAICDDDEEYAKGFRDKLLKYYNDNNILEDSVQCEIYNNSELLIQAYIDESVDVVFMDIEMGELSGFSIAKQLVKYDSNLGIVYITNHDNYVTQAYVCRPLGFIRKKHDDVDIEIAMTSVVEYLNIKHQKYIFRDGKKTLELSLKNVITLEVYNHDFVIVLKDRNLVIQDKLSRVEKDLSQYGFVRIGRGRMVNLKYVDKVEKNKCYIFKDEYAIEGKREKDIFISWVKYQSNY